jgi:hypothetical protein
MTQTIRRSATWIGSMLVVVLWMTAGCATVCGRGGTVPRRIRESFASGTGSLLARQHDDGSWGGDDVKVQSSHKSDYPVAISSLAYLALMTSAAGDQRAELARGRSLRFIFDTIEDDGKMKNTRDNTPKVHERNVWSQSFSMFVFSRLLASETVSAEEKEQIRAKSRRMVFALSKTHQDDGGWTYNKAPSDTMLTGTVLMGLTAIRDAGISVPAGLIEESAAFLAKYSAPGGYVAYKGRPVPERKQAEIGDSLGRSVLLELALVEADACPIKRLDAAVRTFFHNRERLDKIRDLEEGCHQRPHGIGTFYCFYSYFYVAHALETLGGETKRKYRPMLVDHFLGLQKEDGHWMDSKDHCGASYGTAMGLLVLTAPSWAPAP